MCENRPMYDQIVEDVKEYISLRSDSLKLNTVANLSTILGGAIALVICLLFCLLALMIFSVAIIQGLNMLIGSLIWAIIIVGVLYVIIGVVVFAKRQAFINMMVGVFSRMFFEKPTKKRE